MKCPVCQAKLLPVGGDLFCLQCGDLVIAAGSQIPDDDLKLEETTDPLLRRAITDSADSNILFRLPESQNEATTTVAKLDPPLPVTAASHVSSLDSKLTAKPKQSFASLRSMLAWHHDVVSGNDTGATLVPSVHRELLTTGPSVQKLPESQPLAVLASAGVAVVATAQIRKKTFSITTPVVLSIGIISLLMVANVLSGMVYADRVYPGVKVGSTAVGGLNFVQLRHKLATNSVQPELIAVVDGRNYALDTSGVGAVNFDVTQSQAQQAGRDTKVPLIGVVQSLFAPPLHETYSLSEDAVAKLVQQLAARIDRTPTNAAVVIMGTQVLLLAEKPGLKLDVAVTSAAIKTAYGRTKTVSITTLRMQPEVQASAYAGEIAAAQATIGTTVQVMIRKAHYSPTASQIAGWITITGPRQGVIINQQSVIDFVASVPGSFDRSGAVTSLMAALTAHHDTVVVPSIKNTTPNPVLPTAAAHVPAVVYSYCLDKSLTVLPGSAQAIAAAIGDGGNWTLNGKIHFILVGSECNVRLQAGDIKILAALDPACAIQNSCRIHNDIAINSLTWVSPPAVFNGKIPAYQTELVSHAVGQWLGFTHTTCSTSAGAQTPLLSVPSITLSGCSPNWYTVPLELQDTKVLPGL